MARNTKARKAENGVIKGSPGPYTKNSKGEWVPTIPLPYYMGARKRCKCGEKFWTFAGYEGHYALRHILFP